MFPLSRLCLITLLFIILPFSAEAKKKNKFHIDADNEKGLVVFVIKTLDGAASVNVSAVDLDANKISMTRNGFMIMAGKPTTIFSPIPREGEFIDRKTGKPMSLSFAKKKAKPGYYFTGNAINLKSTGKKQAGCYSEGVNAFDVKKGYVNLVRLENPQLDYPEKSGVPWDVDAGLSSELMLEAFIEASGLEGEALQRIVVAPTKRISYEKTHRKSSYLCFPPKSLEIRH